MVFHFSVLAPTLQLTSCAPNKAHFFHFYFRGILCRDICIKSTAKMLFVLPELLCSMYVVCWLHKAPKWTLLELWEPHVLNAAWSMSQQQNMTRVMAGRRYANMWNRVKYFNSHFRMPGSIRFRSPTPPQLPPVPPPSLVVLINVWCGTCVVCL